MADKQWEYRIEKLTDMLSEEYLDKHGLEGWEMAGVDPAPFRNGTGGILLVFKREKAPDYAFLNSPAIESALALGPDGKFLNPEPGAQRPEGASPEGS